MTLQDSLKLRPARWSPAVELHLRITPEVKIKAGTEVLRAMGVTDYDSWLLDAGDLRQDVGTRMCRSSA